jgi:hypothetical protein
LIYLEFYYPKVKSKTTGVIMTHDQAVAIATERFNARCRALMSFWLNGGTEPNDSDYGYDHGWIRVGEHGIGAHDYAPGPTYNRD